MGPRCVAECFSVAAFNIGVVIELVIPENVKIRCIVNLTESSTDGITGGVSETKPPLFQRGTLGGVDVLLAEALGVVLHVAAERTLPFCARCAGRKRFCVELEDKPPIDRPSSFQKRCRCQGIGCVSDGATITPCGYPKRQDNE